MKLNDGLLFAFGSQIQAQCRFGAIAFDELRKTEGDLYKTFYHLQNFINSAANLSKIFWRRSKADLIPRDELISAFNVSDDSPIKATQLRNNCEHIDNRI